MDQLPSLTVKMFDDFETITIKSEIDIKTAPNHIDWISTDNSRQRFLPYKIYAAYRNALQSITTFFGYAIKYSKARGKINLGMSAIFNAMYSYKIWHNEIIEILNDFNINPPNVIHIGYHANISQSKVLLIIKNTQLQLTDLLSLISRCPEFTSLQESTHSLILTIKCAKLAVETWNNDENVELTSFDLSARLPRNDVIFEEIIRTIPETLVMFT